MEDKYKWRGIVNERQRDNIMLILDQANIC